MVKKGHEVSLVIEERPAPMALVDWTELMAPMVPTAPPVATARQELQAQQELQARRALRVRTERMARMANAGLPELTAHKG
jgi:hypothetical protein